MTLALIHKLDLDIVTCTTILNMKFLGQCIQKFRLYRYADTQADNIKIGPYGPELLWHLG